jgi:hypothetical protein
VDEDARDLWVAEAKLAFKLGDDLMDARHGQLIRKGAVAVDLHAIGCAAVAAGNGDFVDV